MKTPGSPYSTAPCTRNSVANIVLPQPAAPHTSVGRPRGKPPLVTSSRPWIPVAAFCRLGLSSTEEIERVCAILDVHRCGVPVYGHRPLNETARTSECG